MIRIREYPAEKRESIRKNQDKEWVNNCTLGKENKNMYRKKSRGRGYGQWRCDMSHQRSILEEGLRHLLVDNDILRAKETLLSRGLG